MFVVLEDLTDQEVDAVLHAARHLGTAAQLRLTRTTRAHVRADVLGDHHTRHHPAHRVQKPRQIVGETPLHGLHTRHVTPRLRMLEGALHLNLA